MYAGQPARVIVQIDTAAPYARFRPQHQPKAPGVTTPIPRAIPMSPPTGVNEAALEQLLAHPGDFSVEVFDFDVNADIAALAKCSTLLLMLRLISCSPTARLLSGGEVSVERLY